MCTAAPCLRKATELAQRIADDLEQNPAPRGRVFVDVRGTLDQVPDPAGLIAELKAARWLPIVWSSEPGQYAGLPVEHKDLKRLIVGDVVVDDEPMIRKCASRLYGARAFGPDVLPQLAALLSEQTP